MICASGVLTLARLRLLLLYGNNRGFLIFRKTTLKNDPMSEENPINHVNKHYLDKVMDLAEEMNVEAIEDIYDTRGMKLVAKGSRISHALQEKLILHRLRKPFESSIALEGGINMDAVIEEAKRISETIDPVACLLKSSHCKGVSAIDVLSRLQIGNAMGMMLTLSERDGGNALTHSVMVSLLSIGLAKKLGLSDKDQSVAGLAGLLHDVGELYIEPEYLDRKKRLLPHEWRHVIVHPRIGQMLIAGLETFLPAVAQAVAEHHERFDGGGYPRRIAGKNISAPGQVVSVAEMISGVLMSQDRPLKRAELAMKIIPGEHAHELVSAVSSALRATPQNHAGEPDMPSEEAHETVRGLFNHISSVKQFGSELIEQSTVKSEKAKELLEQALSQTHAIQRAFISTGLGVCTLEDRALFEASNVEILFEAAVATKEIQWRLRDIARNLSLHSSGLEPDEQDAFQPLITMLDEGCGSSVDAGRQVEAA